jgi:hypothetical protein
MKKIYYFIVLIILLLGGLFLFSYMNKTVVNNFDDCVRETGIVMESYPRQCRTSDGKLFVENISKTEQTKSPEQNDSIRIESPISGSSIDSPLIVKGEAKGEWFFEASFPVELVDSNNNVIATGVAIATTDSLTEDFVPFEAKVEFVSSEQKNGFLILKNDNPSGLFC